MNLPDMTVEYRDPTTAHGIPVPNLSAAKMAKECQYAIQMNHDYHYKGWRQPTIDILIKYSPIPNLTKEEIVKSVYDVFGYRSWKEVSEFVVDDMCSDFFNIALRECITNNQQQVSNTDFIDGTGVGFLEYYRDILKVNLEKAFDCKYFYKVRRPLVYMIEEFGLDLSKVANALHPGHFSFCQGHGTKMYTAVDCLNDVFNLDDECFRRLFIAAYVGSQGRCGNLIHFPMDSTPVLVIMKDATLDRIGGRQVVTDNVNRVASQIL